MKNGVIMIDSVDSYIKRQGDILGMYVFASIPIIIGVIGVFVGSVGFGFLFMLVGVMSLFIAKRYSMYLHGVGK